MTYLQSFLKNEPKYIKSRYNIYLSYYTEGKPEEQQEQLAVFYIYNGFETFYDDDYYDIGGFAPNEYFEINLNILNFYNPIKILKELDNCPLNAYKIDQCVVCLDDLSNIFYNSCSHVCVCYQCDDKGGFKNCPYCRREIEGVSIIKNL